MLEAFRVLMIFDVWRNLRCQLDSLLLFLCCFVCSRLPSLPASHKRARRGMPQPWSTENVVLREPVAFRMHRVAPSPVRRKHSHRWQISSECVLRQERLSAVRRTQPAVKRRQLAARVTQNVAWRSCPAAFRELSVASKAIQISCQLNRHWLVDSSAGK